MDCFGQVFRSQSLDPYANLAFEDWLYSRMSFVRCCGHIDRTGLFAHYFQPTHSIHTRNAYGIWSNMLLFEVQCFDFTVGNETTGCCFFKQQVHRSLFSEFSSYLTTISYVHVLVTTSVLSMYPCLCCCPCVRGLVRL